MPSPETKRRQSAAERRETVLGVAIVEFGRLGMHGTSTERIAAGAGISHPYLFRLFGTKKELFLACLERCHARLRETFTAAAESAPAGEKLTAMGEAYTGLLADRPWLLLQLQGYAACDDPEVRDAAREGWAGLWELVERLSGASDEDVRAFFATGMLLNVVVAMDLPQIGSDPEKVLPRVQDAGA